MLFSSRFVFFQAEDGIRDGHVTGVQTCALPISITVASTNVTTRMWFSMARSGALPHGLARLNRRFKTPVNALFLQTAISIVAGLGVAALIGPANVFNVVGLMFTFALIPVFILGGQ